MVLRKLISDVEEDNSRLANMKLSLEESCEQVTKSSFSSTDTQYYQSTFIFKSQFYFFKDFEKLDLS